MSSNQPDGNRVGPTRQPPELGVTGARQYVREGQFPDVSGCCGTLEPMAKELQPLAVAASSAVTGELLDRTGLAIRAAEVAARQRSPETRRTYAAV